MAYCPCLRYRSCNCMNRIHQNNLLHFHLAWHYTLGICNNREEEASLLVDSDVLGF